MIPLIRFLRFYSYRSTNEIRSDFIKHFCAKNRHKFLPSSSVIPRKGSGTYFTNAGMNQFKQIILGELNSNDILDESKYNGIANSQKCIRIGGKHSDLDSIGKDDYHHTFFEMLGNWSFGSYGKEDACKLAIELLVDTYKLNPNHLYFTYFYGSKEFDIEPDLETKNIWLSLGVPKERLIGFGMKENFWEMDVTGPCGPCTEIHYDRTKANSSHLVNIGDERCIELWNLVFMQYNRLSRKEFNRLPKMVVDTGMGLERLAAVLNEKISNYEIDNFQKIFDQIHHFIGNIPHFNNTSNDELKYAYRTISDHMRSIVVSISDGLMPSKTGLGGYLKYLILKCFDISLNVFKIDKDPHLLLNSLVPIIVNTLKEAYPQLENDISRIQHVIQTTDETRQSKLIKYEEIVKRYLNKINNPSTLNGKQLWSLHKGYGSGEHIPFNFIESYCNEKSIKIDKNGFDKIFLEETENSLKNVKNTRYENTQLIKMCVKLKEAKISETNDSFKYDYVLNSIEKRSISNELRGKIVGLIRVKDENNLEIVDKLLKGDKCIFVLNKTNFYAEEGGQDSDSGIIININGHQASIHNVKKLQGYVFHYGQIESGEWLVGDEVSLEFDQLKRFKTTLNHTSIHLLNHVLRSVYQNENSIVQVNSLAKQNYFKFEFLFNGDFTRDVITPQIIDEIQQKLQQLIDKELEINDTQIDFDDQNALKQVRKLRDVLYPHKVRVVHVGSQQCEDYSAELCCGTHATNSKQLKKIIIKNFSSTNDGHYEVEACSGDSALNLIENDLFLEKIYQQMKKLNQNYYHDLNSLAIKSGEIENYIKKNPASLSFRNKLEKELDPIRPSKYKLQKETKKYFDEILKTTNLIEIESILDNISLNSIINKLDLTNHSKLIIFNRFRNICFIYCTDKSVIRRIEETFKVKQEPSNKFIAIRLPNQMKISEIESILS